MDFGRYTDHRATAVEQARDLRVAHNAAEAVVKLSSNDAKHIETYKKIMARKSNGEEQFANVEDDNDEQDGGNNAGAGVEPVAGYGQIDGNRLL